MRNTLSEYEKEKLDELFLAIYFNDLERVVSFKEQYPEIFELRHRFLTIEWRQFDLTDLTILNQTVWFSDEWEKWYEEDDMPFVMRQREGTKRMLDFWRYELEQDKLVRQFVYNDYYMSFRCSDPDDYDEIITDPISLYLEKGFREIDLRLYNRVQAFDFAAVRSLLEQGANPDVILDEENPESSSYLSIPYPYWWLMRYVKAIFDKFESKAYDQEFIIWRTFGDLLGLAAHVEMHRLLGSYHKEE